MGGWQLGQSAISKYHGLQRIDEYGLRHPSWVFIEKASQLPRKPWANAPEGWTVRCCPDDEYVFGMPSKHMQLFQNLPAVIQALGAKAGRNTRFVVYPSWQFDRSGCCMIVGENKIIVEAVLGDIAPLLRGKATPDAVYESQGPYHRSLTFVGGDKETLCNDDLNFLLMSCRRIQTESTIVLEWTKTTDSVILFHDWLELS